MNICRPCLLICIILAGMLFSVGNGHAMSYKTLLDQSRSIFMIHGIDTTSIEMSNAASAAPAKSNLTRGTLPNLEMLSAFPSKNRLLPFHDVETTVSRIASLTTALENRLEGETAQQIKVNLAYEYLLLYLYYQHQKFLFMYQNDQDMVSDPPISDREIQHYLAWAEYLLSSFMSTGGDPVSPFDYGETGQFDTDDISFPIRDSNTLFLNINFLGLMIACEARAAQWPEASQFNIFNCDQKTYTWLKNLWRRYRQTQDNTQYQGTNRNSDRKMYIPDGDTLFSLYDLYLRYHFLALSLDPSGQSAPVTDSMTRTLINRLMHLQKNSAPGNAGLYRYYMTETSSDGGNTSFLPSLFFARRGYAVAKQLDPKNLSFQKELFDFYLALFQDASNQVKFNIPFRSRIYNEMILFGITFDNLRIMEDVLYDYGCRALRISPEDKYKGTDFEKSSRLTMAYLLANILDKKRRSGLDDDSDKYRQMVNSLSSSLISAENHNWKYASIMHSALAVYFSRENRPNHDALAMYHARETFLAPCRKISITYGDSHWLKYFQLPADTRADTYLELFLYFHNKYPTIPESKIPTQYNAHKIIQHSIKYAKN